MAYLERENADSKAALEKQRKQHASSEARLTQQLKSSAAEIDCLRATHLEGAARQTRLAAFESGSAMLDLQRELMRLQAANEELMVSAQRSVALEISLHAAQDEAQANKRERDELIGERDALERLLLADEAPGLQEDHCSGQCAACEHATQFRNVLCVGGRSSLVVQYRALAQRLGMRLLHHDGGLEEALPRLPDMIKGADDVMCPMVASRTP